jgi:transposase
MDDIVSGLSLQKTANKYRVSKQWIQTLKKRFKETGSYEAKPLQGVAGRKRVLKNYQEQLQELVTQTPDAALEELVAQLPVKVSTSMVYRELQFLKLTYKKSGVCRRTRPTDVAQKRAEWKVKQLGLNPGKLVFIDESGAKTTMTRRYGRSPKGKPIVDKVPHGHWQNITYVCGIRRSGIVAPKSFVGGMTTKRFVAYIRDEERRYCCAGQFVGT